MIITNLNAGIKAGISIEGTVLKIDNKVSIDLQAHQKDTQKIVDVCLDNQLKTMREGMGAWYVATIIVPARQYDLVKKENEDEDEEGADSTQLIARPLDTSNVEVQLWALPAEYLEPDLEIENREEIGK